MHQKLLKIGDLFAQPRVCQHFRPRIYIINTIQPIQGY